MILRIVDNNDHSLSASKALVPQLLVPETGDRSNITGRVCRFAVFRVRGGECNGRAFQCSILVSSRTTLEPTLCGFPDI